MFLSGFHQGRVWVRFGPWTNRPYRTDSCSIRAAGGSPPSASLEEISQDEKMDIVSGQVSDWLSSIQRAMLTLRQCVVIPCHKLHHHSWHVPATFDSGGAWFHFICNTSKADLFHFQLSGSAHFHFMSSTIMADMFQDIVPATFDSQTVCDSISFAAPFKADFFLPFSIIRMCVIPFHLRCYHGWHIPATFDSQAVRIAHQQPRSYDALNLPQQQDHHNRSATSGAGKKRQSLRQSSASGKPHACISARWKDAASIILEENVWTGMWGVNILMRNVRFFSSSLHLKRIYSPLRFYLVAHRCPYPDCGKDLSRHDNLMQHLRVHKDYVPFGSSSSS